MTYCYKCGNRGKEGGCPNCGKTPAQAVLDITIPGETIAKTKRYKEILIPEYYLTTIWSKEAFWKNHASQRTETALIRFIDQLEKVLQIFEAGTVPAKSAFIIAPNGYSKCIFAYTCMKLALNRGFTVAPLIDTTDLKRLFVSSTTKNDYRLYHNISMDDYILSDVVFITVVKSHMRYDAYLTVQDLIEKRLRFNKPTFIISEHSLEEISQWDAAKNYKNYLKATEGDNQLKYPVVLQYKEPSRSSAKKMEIV